MIKFILRNIYRTKLRLLIVANSNKFRNNQYYISNLINRKLDVFSNWIKIHENHLDLYLVTYSPTDGKIKSNYQRRNERQIKIIGEKKI